MTNVMVNTVAPEKLHGGSKLFRMDVSLVECSHTLKNAYIRDLSAERSRGLPNACLRRLITSVPQILNFVFGLSHHILVPRLETCAGRRIELIRLPI